MENAYSRITSIGNRDYSNHRVLVVGAGWMGGEFLKTLRALGVCNTVAITTIEETAVARRVEFGIEVRLGPVEATLRENEAFDLVVIATPIDSLLSVCRHVLAFGYRNILLEKPGSLWSSELKSFAEEVEHYGARIRLAYNRNVYPNLILLEQLAGSEGGITSCRYTFTEWVHRIDFTKASADVYRRWGISNSLHPIGMAHRLIGMPVQLSAQRGGTLDWHPSGARFSGSGLTDRGVIFSYDADWESAGRWSVEVRTTESAYRMVPLETLEVCHRGSVQWNPVTFEAPVAGVKAGVAEELAVMLDRSLEPIASLPTLGEGMRLARLAEEIFGYESSARTLRTAPERK